MYYTMIEAIDLKFDLHCHTKEGSIDSKVSVAEFADRFMELGYDGFMISDHNSYKGCKAWDAIKNDPKYRNFTVIRGIEYDTKDAGHILVILPDGIYPRVLRIRGLKCSTLIKLVHSLGGILGPAHPFGVATSSAMGFKKMKMSYIKHFDFIETFNTCEFVNSNHLAKDLADRFDMPSFAGSDAHDQGPGRIRGHHRIAFHPAASQNRKIRGDGRYVQNHDSRAGTGKRKRTGGAEYPVH